MGLFGQAQPPAKARQRKKQPQAGDVVPLTPKAKKQATPKSGQKKARAKEGDTRVNRAGNKEVLHGGRWRRADRLQAQQQQKGEPSQLKPKKAKAKPKAEAAPQAQLKPKTLPKQALTPKPASQKKARAKEGDTRINRFGNEEVFSGSRWRRASKTKQQPAAQPKPTSQLKPKEAKPQAEPKQEKVPTQFPSLQFAQKNFKYLGGGIEGDVYLEPGTNRAYKYFGTAVMDEESEQYLRRAGEGGWAPKVYEVSSDRRAFVMEYLAGFQPGIHPGSDDDDDADSLEHALSFDPTPYDRALLKTVRKVQQQGWIGDDLHEDNVMLNPETMEIKFVDQGGYEAATPKLIAEQLLNFSDSRPMVPERIQSIINRTGTTAIKREYRRLRKQIEASVEAQQPLSDAEYERIAARIYQMVGI